MSNRVASAIASVWMGPALSSDFLTIATCATYVLTSVNGCSSDKHLEKVLPSNVSSLGNSSCSIDGK